MNDQQLLREFVMWDQIGNTTMRDAIAHELSKNSDNETALLFLANAYSRATFMGRLIRLTIERNPNCPASLRARLADDRDNDR